VNSLTNLIDFAYTIGNFEQKLSIFLIFSVFAHLRKYEKKCTILVKNPCISYGFYMLWISK